MIRPHADPHPDRHATPARRLLRVGLGLTALLAVAVAIAVSFGAAEVPLWQRLFLGGAWSESQRAILLGQ